MKQGNTFDRSISNNPKLSEEASFQILFGNKTKRNVCHIFIPTKKRNVQKIPLKIKKNPQRSTTTHKNKKVQKNQQCLKTIHSDYQQLKTFNNSPPRTPFLCLDFIYYIDAKFNFWNSKTLQRKRWLILIEKNRLLNTVIVIRNRKSLRKLCPFLMSMIMSGYPFNLKIISSF